MPFPQRRFELQKPVVVDVGCGCRQSIFSTLFSASSSSLKQRIPESLPSSSPSSRSPQKKARIAVKRKKRKKKAAVAEESVAVVKESLNPYLDFYESMLVMIMEKEIYDWKDLCDLLQRYLSLNSSCHHHIILRAFADIRDDVFSPTAEEPEDQLRTSSQT